MPTVLLAWEFGGGFGHVVTLRRIAARLKAHGFRFVAAVRDLAAAAQLVDDGIELVQAPLWNTPESSATLGDMLGDAGFGAPQVMRPRIEAWRAIIDRYKPALVITDYAPGANLAARGRIPLAVVGTGFTLPPPEMACFPPLHQASPPVWREPQILDAINSVAADLGLRKLQWLPELFDGDVKWVYTFPLLDPYAAWRQLPAQGPIIEEPEPRAADPDEILIYLSWSSMQRPLLQALRPFASNIRIFAPALPRHELAAAADLGMRVEPQPFRLMHDLARARHVIHLGSGGTATTCLWAGVPQLACAMDIEKELNGRALARAGVGKVIPIYDPAIELTEEIMAEALADETTAERAQAVSEELRTLYRSADPLGDFEAACLRLTS